MRAHFVDTILARLDGEVACIWVTIAVTAEPAPSIDALRAQVVAAYRATPRLGRVWSDYDASWRAIERGDAELARTVEVHDEPRTRAEILSRVIDRRIDLARDPAFLVGVHALEGGATLMTFQLHHAVGDARALGRLLERMFGAAPRAPSTRKGPGMNDGNVVMGALMSPRATARLALGRTRMLASRGVSLPRDGDDVGAPQVSSVRLELVGDTRAHARWFYAAVAATCARWTAARSGAVRLRVPVDLSRQFVFEDVVANTCITVPLELDVRRLREQPAAPYVDAALESVLADGAVWPALIETLVVGRLAPRRVLRSGARPGLIAERRTNTMVATYVGSIDRYFEAAPFRVVSAVGHTPTWGANGFTVDGTLVVNVSCFEGLWRRETLVRFRNDVATWLVEHADARVVEHGP